MGHGAIIELPWALMAGVGIGLFYFGGLWWTLKRLPGHSYPALWVLGSFLSRAGLSVTVLYWTTGGKWDQVTASLAGFILVRTVIVKRVRTRQKEAH